MESDEAVPRRRKKDGQLVRPKGWDEEIVPFDELEWSKVTAIIDPEHMPLTTCKLLCSYEVAPFTG